MACATLQWIVGNRVQKNYMELRQYLYNVSKYILSVVRKFVIWSFDHGGIKPCPFVSAYVLSCHAWNVKTSIPLTLLPGSRSRDVNRRVRLSTWNLQSALSQNIVFGFEFRVLRMPGIRFTFSLLFLLLLIVNPCVPEPTEREKSLDLHDRGGEGDVTPEDETPAENHQISINHEQAEGHGSNEEAKQKDESSVRSELTNADFTVVCPEGALAFRS